MTKTMRILISTVITTAVISLAGFSSSVFANDDGMDQIPEPTAAEIEEQETALAEMNAREEYLGYIHDNRDSVIDDLVAQWEYAAEGYFIEEGDRDVWRSEFAGMLQSADAFQLEKIANASSYDEVRSILGYSAFTLPESLDDTSVVIPNTNHNRDLVFSPSTPCRFVDTRYDTFSTPNNSYLYLYVMGSGSQLSLQGGNSAGCSSASGTEPGAVAINMTVVPLSKGHIRVYPYNSPVPTASFLNFNTDVNSNLANAGIVKNCYGCARDISVYVYHSAEVIGDLMGVFDLMPVTQQGTRVSNYYTSSNKYCGSCGNWVYRAMYIPHRGWIEAEVDTLVSHTPGSYNWFTINTSSTSTSCQTTDYGSGYLGAYSYVSSSDGHKNISKHTSRKVYYSSGGTKYFYFRPYGTSGSSCYVNYTAIRLTYTPVP